MTKPSYEELRKRYEAMKPPDLSPRASGAMWNAPQTVTLTLSYCVCGMAKWKESDKCDRCVVLSLLTDVEESERKLKKTSWMRGMISSQALTIRQQIADLARVRGLLQRSLPTLEWAYEQSRNSPSSHQEFVREDSEHLAAVRAALKVGAESADIGKLDTADKSGGADASSR